jgi:iron complex outermembrane receptor protein
MGVQMTLSKRSRWLLASAITSSLISGAMPAIGQPSQNAATNQVAQASQGTQTNQSAQSDQDAQAGQDGTKLETITVSGVRGFSSDVTQVGSFRGAKIVDTPMTVSVLPRDLLDSQQALNLNDSLRNVAGVNNSQTSTVVTSGQSVRGIALDNRNGYRLDGGLPIINLLDMPTEDKERVELLKGASALYYGFASPAGVVNLTMKRPTSDPLLDVTTFGNMYGALGGAVDFGSTLQDGKFGYRINGVYTGVNPGIQHTTGNRSLIAAALDYHPIQSIVMQLDLEHIYKSQPEPGVFQYATAKVPALTPTIANPYPSLPNIPDIHTLDPRTNWAPTWAQYRAEEYNVFSHNTWAINDWLSLSVDAGVSRLARTRDFTTITPTNLTTGQGVLNYQFSTAQDENRNLRAELAGTYDTFGLIHNFSVGWSDNIRDTFQVSAPLENNSTAAANFISPTDLPREAPPVLSGPTNRVDDMGTYFFDRVQYTDYFEVLGGVRLGNYHENTVKPTQVQTFHAAPVTTAGSVVLKPLGDDDLSVYASYIEALQTTAAAPPTAANPSFQPPPTPSFEHEVGIKYVPWTGLLLQVAGFNIGQGNAVIDSNNVYGLNGRNRFQGVEGSLTGAITDDLSVSLSAMTLQATVVSGTPTCGPGTVEGTLNGSCKTFTPTLVGNKVDNTAKAYASAFVEYKLGGLFNDLEGLAVNAGLYYVGARYVDPLNEARIGDYTLLDLGASYSTDAFAYPMTFRINARNVGDRRYWAATSSNLLAEGQPADVEFSIQAHL